MKCSICKKEEAVIHIHEYSNNGTRRINLCLNCAVQRGFDTSFEKVDQMLINLINNIFGTSYSIKGIDGNNVTYKLSLICPSCHTSIEDISKNFKFGCITCYTIFESIIDLLILKQNNSLNYLGKLPKDLNVMENDRKSLGLLKGQLKEAVKNEDYIRAALLRDQIIELKKKIQKRVRKIANK